jgi:hypothetical protein
MLQDPWQMLPGMLHALGTHNIEGAKHDKVKKTGQRAD